MYRRGSREAIDRYENGRYEHGRVDRERFLVALRALRRIDPFAWSELKGDPYEMYHVPVNDEEACLNLIHKAYGVPRVST